MNQREPEFYKTREVAARERVSIETVRRWAAQGRIPSFRNPGGRGLCFPRDYREQTRH